MFRNADSILIANCHNVFHGNKAYTKHFAFQVFQFLNAKCESAFLSKRNPRQINWTVLYRRKHKKGQSVSTYQLMAL